MYLTEKDYTEAAEQFSLEPAVLKAVAQVESAGCGFLKNGKPKILFEPFLFGSLTKGKFEGIEWNGYPLSITGKRWSVRAARYGSESIQYAKMEAAAAYASDAAYMASSWGKFQVLGMHYAKLGYPSLTDFVETMHRSEKDHLDAMLRYCSVSGIIDELQRKDWAGFACGYNGKGYRALQYDGRLASAYYHIKQAEEMKQNG